MPITYQEDSIRKFGRNAAVGTTTADIWTPTGVRTWLTAASALEVISDDANDDAAGTGAQQVTIQGLDENFDEAEETVTMNGTSASTATTTTFIRVNRVFVSRVGTYHGRNAGNITIRIESGGATQAHIVAGKGQTEQTHYSIPRNTYFLLKQFWASVETTKNVTIDLFRTEGIDDVTAPFAAAARKVHGFSGITEQVEHMFCPPARITGPADVWIEGLTSTGTAVVEAGFSGDLTE